MPVSDGRNPRPDRMKPGLQDELGRGGTSADEPLRAWARGAMGFGNSRQRRPTRWGPGGVVHICVISAAARGPRPTRRPGRLPPVSVRGGEHSPYLVVHPARALAAAARPAKRLPPIGINYGGTSNGSPVGWGRPPGEFRVFSGRHQGAGQGPYFPGISYFAWVDEMADEPIRIALARPFLPKGCHKAQHRPLCLQAWMHAVRSRPPGSPARRGEMSQ